MIWPIAAALQLALVVLLLAYWRGERRERARQVAAIQSFWESFQAYEKAAARMRAATDYANALEGYRASLEERDVRARAQLMGRLAGHDETRAH